MIKIKMSIEDINEYQIGILPKNAVKIETPQGIDETMKKAAPIAAMLCILMFATMLCKTIINKTVVVSPIFIFIGFCLGFVLLVVHEWLHGIVYPTDASVTICNIMEAIICSVSVISSDPREVYLNVSITIYTGNSSVIDFYW